MGEEKLHNELKLVCGATQEFVMEGFDILKCFIYNNNNNNNNDNDNK